MMELIVAFHSMPKNCVGGDGLDLAGSAHGSVRLFRRV